MNDFGELSGTGTGVGLAAAAWALVKVLKKDRVAEALEAVTKELHELRTELHELRTQVAVLLDREDLREKRLADMEDRLRKLENGRHAATSRPDQPHLGATQSELAPY